MTSAAGRNFGVAVCGAMSHDDASNQCRFDVPSVLLALPAESHLLSQQTEMRVMTEQAQHNKIGIETVETMSCVRIATSMVVNNSCTLRDVWLTNRVAPCSNGYTLESCVHLLRELHGH